MNTKLANLFLTLCFVNLWCDPTRAASISRVRRQGWTWGNIHDPQAPPELPTRNPNLNQSPAPTIPIEPTTTKAPASFTQCMNACLTTPQYNPVCGTDKVTYDNANRLKCARNCGIDVEVLFMGTCVPVTR